MSEHIPVNALYYCMHDSKVLTFTFTRSKQSQRPSCVNAVSFIQICSDATAQSLRYMAGVLACYSLIQSLLSLRIPRACARPRVPGSKINHAISVYLHILGRRRGSSKDYDTNYKKIVLYSVHLSMCSDVRA